MAKSLRILVVVDDRDVAEGLSEVLEMAGHEVALALSVESAKGLLEQNTYDIGFFNVRQPGKGTVETFVGLRRLQPSLEAIMMTGMTTEQLLAEIVVEGHASMLNLPLDFSSIDKSLDFAMPRGLVLVPSNGTQLADDLCAQLRESGRDAAIARSEPEALDLFGRKPDHHIILDLQVSVVSALSVYLKLSEVGYSLPLIIIGRPPITGTDTASPFRDLWVTGVLFKPFDPRKLLNALDQSVPASPPGEVASPLEEQAALPPAAERPETVEAPHIGSGDPEPGAGDETPAGRFEYKETDASWDAPEEFSLEFVEDDQDGQSWQEASAEEEPAVEAEEAASAGHDEPGEPRLFEEAEGTEAENPHPVEEQEPAAEPASHACEGKVLIVDDDREMAEGIQEILESRGYETKKAYSFDEAIVILKDFPAQVALIDVQIGGSSGLDLIPRLQAELPLLVPVMLTARADKDTIVAALRSGAYDYLTKPLDPAELFTALERSFDRLRLAAGGAEDLLARISYGMRTPLNTVVGFSEILKNELLGPIGSDKYVGYAADIHTAGQAISGMLGTIVPPEDAAAGDSKEEGHEEEIPFAPADAAEEAETGETGEASASGPGPQRFDIPSLEEIRGTRPTVSDDQEPDQQAV